MLEKGNKNIVLDHFIVITVCWGGYQALFNRDVIRSPDIRTFESRSEVRTQVQHPEVRIKYKNVKKCTISFRKYFRIIAQRGNLTSSSTSDFADENTTCTIGDNCHRCVFVWVDLISKRWFLSYSHVLSIQWYLPRHNKTNNFEVWSHRNILPGLLPSK